ncbi:COR413IM2 protein [Hibiscus syriacus]|uniref:COR413IM2 protein n=1 Tax=Hibiscus syriacus TaxID=106335 RepID=A0A6A3CPC3_HIBSY|nr:cold-regulated 413 inner membrane protein 2, chloroplastic-like [Hibiscus syriacus]XP_039025645.1 cold-regulated 413 inner membrane protein 2, chloroplastic-like [Hibiscus syriacus]KAE8731013.1 COR413IM2 protein [Hibiscus syriacus]
MKKMLTLSISPAPQSLHISTARHLPVLPFRNAPLPASTKLSTLAPSSAWISFNPLRFSIKDKDIKKKSRGSSAVCSAAPLSPRNLQWISAISSAILLFTKGTVIRKHFLVPLFAIQAPASIIAWMKGEYGLWAAFLALLVRLFFFIPGELELPFLALLLVIVAPYQVLNIRGTQQAAIIALVIAAYLAFQHFSGAGSLQKAFDQGSIIATIAVVCITVISGLLLV